MMNKKIRKSVFIVALVCIALALLGFDVLRNMRGPHPPIHKVRVQVQSLESALLSFHHEYRRWPQTSDNPNDPIDHIKLIEILNALGANTELRLQQNPRDIHFIRATDYGPGLTDPWGNPYHIEIDKEKNEVRVWSGGPKGKWSKGSNN